MSRFTTRVFEEYMLLAVALTVKCDYHQSTTTKTVDYQTDSGGSADDVINQLNYLLIVPELQSLLIDWAKIHLCPPFPTY